MLDKCSWLVIVQVFDGKRFAFARRVAHSTNLLSELARLESPASVNIADSKKAADELVEYWNKCYKENGILYDWR